MPTVMPCLPLKSSELALCESGTFRRSCENDVDSVPDCSFLNHSLGISLIPHHDSSILNQVLYIDSGACTDLRWYQIGGKR